MSFGRLDCLLSLIEARHGSNRSRPRGPTHRDRHARFHESVYIDSATRCCANLGPRVRRGTVKHFSPTHDRSSVPDVGRVAAWLRRSFRVERTGVVAGRFSDVTRPRIGALLLGAVVSWASAAAADPPSASDAARWVRNGAAVVPARGVQPGVRIVARRWADVDGNRMRDLVAVLRIPDEMSAVVVFLRTSSGWEPRFVVGMDSCDEYHVGQPSVLAAPGLRLVHVEVERCGQPARGHELYVWSPTGFTSVWTTDAGRSELVFEGRRYRVTQRGRVPTRVSAAARSH